MDLSPLVRSIWLLTPALAVLYVSRLLYRQLDLIRLRRAYQCKDVTQYPHKDKWGADLIQLRGQAMKDGYFFKLYEQHFAQFGKTWSDSLRGQLTINTIDPSNLQAVLAKDFDSFGMPQMRSAAMRPLFGRTVFNTEGPEWKHSRALIKPTFAKAELSDTTQLDLFVERFFELLPEGEAFDVQPLLHRLFMDVSTDFVFGKSIDALGAGKLEAEEFNKSFNKALRIAGQRREAGWVEIFSRWNKEWLQACRDTHRFVDQQVARALQESNDSLEKDTSRNRYVVLDEIAKEVRDPVQLRDLVLGVFLPAREATSILVGNCLFQLARHPEIWERLRAIALDVKAPYTFEKLKSLVDFRHVLQETMRTIGPAARVVRLAKRDTVLPKGGGADQQSPVLVKKGTMVSCGIWCIQHDPDTWGEDVQEFKPERWQNRTVTWEFIPFSGGPRMCPAMQQSYIHGIYLLVRLMQRFKRLENQDPVLEWSEKWSFVFESRNGVKISLHNE